MRTLGIMLTASLLLAGCATVPMAGTGADAEGKRFDPPPPGRSVLYVYRGSMLGTESIFNIADNQQPVGALADRTWIRIDVAPGPHVIACSIQSYAPLTQDPAQAATVNLAPGEMRFVEAVISNYWIYQLRMGKPTPTLDQLAQHQWPRYEGK